MQKLKLWYQIIDLGDGSHTVKLFFTEDEAKWELDEDGFHPSNDIPYEVDEVTLSGNITSFITGEGS